MKSKKMKDEGRRMDSMIITNIINYKQIKQTKL
jgi:hypothetical protein